MMVGERVLDAMAHGAHARGGTALQVSGLTRGTRVRNVSFAVAAGEIFGLAGLVGSGRTETLRAIFGADVPDAGVVTRGGSVALAIRRPSDAVRAGIGMIPEDRKAQAILHSQPVRANMTLAALRTCTRAGWWIDSASEARVAETLRVRLDVRAHSLDQPAGELSGGNQQKVVMSRWLLRECDVLLFDEPTRGIDVAARASIYGLLRELAGRGKALVVVSSDLPELMALCDRIGVLSAGRLVATFDRAEYTQERIMAAAFSGDARGRGAASSC
jgi:ribose transport system ATP-binding protein